MFDQMLIFAPPILSSSQKSQLNDELKNGSKVEHTELTGRAKIQEKRAYRSIWFPCFFLDLEKKSYIIYKVCPKKKLRVAYFFWKRI